MSHRYRTQPPHRSCRQTTRLAWLGHGLDEAVRAWALLVLLGVALPVQAQTTLSGDITSTDPLVYTEPVVLISDVTITAPSVTFEQTVDGTTDGQESLSITSAGETRFDGEVGASVRLDALTIDGGGTVVMNPSGGINLIGTRGTQQYDNDVIVEGNTRFSAFAGSATDLIFNGTLDGPRDLIMTVSGQTVFNDAVGATVPLFGIQTNTTGTLVVNTTTVTAVLGQDYRNHVEINPPGSATTTFTSTTSLLRFRKRVEAANEGEDAVALIASTLVEFRGQTNVDRKFTAFSVQGSTTFDSAATLFAGSTPVFNGSFLLEAGADLDVRIAGDTPGTGYDQVQVIGSVDVTDADLVTTLDSDFTPTPGQPFIIVSNDGTDAVTGTFNGLPEGENFSVDLVTFQISYAGGDGNDIVLTTMEVLPVELTAFDVVLDGSTARLSWKTASETNNAGFEIQRRYRSEGRRAAGGAAAEPAGEPARWEALGWVGGAGTTIEEQAYRFAVEALVPGRYTFRLKQIDYDGTFAYSPEVEVTVDLPERLALSAYPNPFNPQTTVRFAVAREAPVRLVLYNGLGQEVRVLYEGIVAAGQTKAVRVDGSGLTSGVYFARLRSEGASATQQLVFVK